MVTAAGSRLWRSQFTMALAFFVTFINYGVGGQVCDCDGFVPGLSCGSVRIVCDVIMCRRSVLNLLTIVFLC